MAKLTKLGMEMVTFSGRNHSRTIDSPIILAVDDNEDNLLLLRYCLEPLGCHLICEAESQKALLIAYEQCPDLVLLDILLPVLNGFDFVRCLQSNPLTSHIPAIAVTALVHPEERQEILNAGFVDYVSKPYEIDYLESIIRQHLSLKLAWQCG
jgi:CheY-like chemotaxis protein